MNHTVTPAFPAFREIALSDRDEIVHGLAESQPETSELTFTSLFSWREVFRTAWCRLDQWLLFRERREDGTFYLLPPAGPYVPPELVTELLVSLGRAGGEAEPAIERVGGRQLAAWGALAFRVEAMPEHADYVYDRRRLATLCGRHLRDKRRLVRQFRRGDNFRHERLAPAHLDGCRQVLAEWLARRQGQADAGLLAECAATGTALDHLRELPTTGSVLIVREQVVAFAVTERLNATTQVTQFEKFSSGLPGLPALLVQQGAAACGPDVAWINRGQDLGLPGLRQAKRSWRPEHLVAKFRVCLNRGRTDRPLRGGRVIVPQHEQEGKPPCRTC